MHLQTRRGSAQVFAIVAAAGCAVAIAAGFLFQRSAVQEAELDRQNLVATERQAVEQARDAATQQAVAEVPVVNEATSQAADDQAEADKAVAVVTEPQTVEAVAEPSLRERIEAHLEFGEFTRAVELAELETGIEERSVLMSLVADAQMQIGDFDAALGSVRSIPDYNERMIVRDRLGRESSMAGGSGANFDQLIDLIMQETEGMWLEDDGDGGTISQFDQGVHVNPTGVLERVSTEDQNDRLKALGIRAREALLNNDIASVSGMRVVSLTRLEDAVARRLAQGRSPVVSQKLMGGLTQIQHVFVYPEDGEVVLVGPAEAWKYNDNGIPVGVESGRPVLQLDDFVTILRTFSQTGQEFFSCSINPRPEGLKALQDYVAASSGTPLRPGSVRRWTEQLQEKLGRQDIVFKGISPESRVARIIVEADYRMKLVGIGKYDFNGGSKVPSIFDLMTAQEQQASKLDALRWWLSMKYDAVRHTADSNGFEFVGSSVLCQSENQFLNDQGQQVQTGQSDGANRLFAETFTNRYEELAARDLVFADLKNVFDLALVAAILHNEGAADRANWDYGVFGSEGAYLTDLHEAPREVDSVVNHRTFRGRDIVVQVAGGVRVDLASVLDNPEVRQQAVRLDSTARKAHSTDELPANRWWWDAR